MRWLVWVLVLAVLSACADSETRSVVSASDLPGTKYRRIAVFLENSDPARPSPSPSVHVGGGQVSLIVPAARGSTTDKEIEQKIVSALKEAGIFATAGAAAFNGQKLSDQAKAKIIQKDFDAVLYVHVLVNGMREEQVKGAWHDGRVTNVHGDVEEIDHYITNSYELKPDGTVWHRVPTFHARSDLQDTKTNKQVWSGETIATGGTLVLVTRASSQIVEKLRSDGAI